MGKYYYTVRCWDDVGGPEDGIVSHYFHQVIKADNIFDAYNKVKERGFIPCWKYEEKYAYTREIPDAHLSTPDEIAEYEMERREEEEYKANYGCYPWEDFNEEDDPTQSGSLDYPATPWGGTCY